MKEPLNNRYEMNAYQSRAEIMMAQAHLAVNTARWTMVGLPSKIAQKGLALSGTELTY
jgi:hypothetical protein